MGLQDLHRRPSEKLPWLDPTKRFPGILLDTTLYIDELQARLPERVESFLRATPLWHSTVTESELTTLLGLLDPAHPGTARITAQVVISIEKRPAHRILNPSPQVWREAGVAAGLIARFRQYNKADHRRVLNDALLFFSALHAGVPVLTRNTSDFDLLLQIAPQGQALFYEAATRST